MVDLNGDRRRWAAVGAVLEVREPDVFARLLALAETVIAARSSTDDEEKEATPLS